MVQSSTLSPKVTFLKDPLGHGLADADPLGQ